MIAVVLAAGRGSRLNNYTNDVPKSLLPLKENLSILDYNLNILKELNIDLILVVTGYEADQIVEKTKTINNLKCIYNPFWNTCNVLGSLFVALPYINQDFLFLHADTIVSKKVWIELSNQKGDIVLPYQKKECGEEEMKVRLNPDGSLAEINKTMNPELAVGEFLGIAKFSKNMKDHFQSTSEKLFKNGNLNLYMEAVLADSIGIIPIKTLDIKSEFFIEIDFEEDYLKAKSHFELINKSRLKE